MSQRYLTPAGLLSTICIVGLLISADYSGFPLAPPPAHSAESAQQIDVKKVAVPQTDAAKPSSNSVSGQKTGAAEGKTAQGQSEPGLPLFDDICFDDFGSERPYPGIAQLQELLGQVPGHGYTFQLQHEHNRMLVQLRGMYQLKPRWQEGSLLRMAVTTYRPLRMYLWRGQRGVAIIYYPSANHSWMAYSVTRQGNQPQPDTYALWACDGWRYQQSWGGTVLLLYRDGVLHLLRGDLALLSIPCPEPPQETYLDVEGLVRGLEMTSCRGGPDRPKPPRTLLAFDKPAQAEWKVTAGKGVSLRNTPDGAVELISDEKGEGGHALVHLGTPAWRELVFLVEEAEPGTGLCFADADGKPFLRFAFLREVTGKRLGMSFWEVGNNSIEHWADIQNTISPCAGKPQWVKILPGIRHWRFAVSGDGIHWSYFPTPLSGPRPQCVYAGLYTVPGEQKRKIRLRSLRVELLEGLDAAVPAEARKQFASFPPRAEETNKLLAALREFVTKPVDAQLRMKALEEAVLVLAGGEGQVVEDIATLYARLGQSLIDEKFDRPLSAVSASLMSVPITRHEFETVKLHELLLAELIPLMYRNDRREISRLCGRIRLWQGHRRRTGSLPDEERMLAHISDWAAGVIRWEGLPSGYVPKGAAGALRSLAMPQISRDGYTVLADLQAAVQGQALKDACQIILAQVNPFGFGLMPDSADHRLLTSFPAAVRLMFQRNPALQKTMGESFGPVGRIRLQEATRSGDHRAVQAVAVLFHGTEVAVEAYQWLGDRAMAAGQFSQAIGAYRQALFGASTEQWHSISARARLAGAMIGRELGRPPSQPVRIGSTEFTPDQFEKLIAELQRARQPGLAGTFPTTALPPPKQYRLAPLGKLEGKDVAAPPGNHGSFDWAARQVCLTPAGAELLVCDRSELCCFAAADRRLVWRQKLQADKGQQVWPAGALRPAVGNNAIYVRRLMRDGPELVALSRTDGKVLWTFNSAGAVVCDPLAVGHELMVLTTRPVYPQKLLLSVCWVDALSGELVAQRPLCEFRDQWRGALPFQAMLVNDRIVATGGGCVICLDPTGQLLWLRQPVWIAPHEETLGTAWVAQTHQPPLVFGDYVYVTQPGMYSIECLDLYTGRLVWYESSPRMTALLGLAGDKLIVETADSLAAFDARSGKKLWRRQLRALANLCSADGLVIATREERSNSPRSPAAVLQWLDLKDGAVTHQSPLDLPERELIGPLAAWNDKFWLCHAPPGEPAARTVAELVAVQ